MRYIYLSICLVFFFSNNSLSASTATFDPPVLAEVLSKDFPLFKDSDDKIIYIDFELLTTNVKSLKIVNPNGSVNFQDDLSDKNVNDIYEFDYSSYVTGIYRLELHAYSGDVLNAEFEIK